MENTNLESKKIPFPQANDINKIILILGCTEEEIKNDSYLVSRFKISKRQIHYYISACQFLDLIDRERKFTLFGKNYKKMNSDVALAFLLQSIVSKPVFGHVFFYNMLNKSEMDNQQISDLISMYFNINNSSVAFRRASTVKKWIEWIQNSLSK